VKFRRVIGFVIYFTWEVIKANLHVAYEVITPQHHMKPAILAIPLDVKTDLEITAFANLITLTPGTLSLEVSEDRKTLYIHAMYVDDVTLFKERLKKGLERRLLQVLR
jgi:multicomponent Na+:H+ antiporter subunit E